MLPLFRPSLLEVAKCDTTTADILYSQYFLVNRDLASGAPDFVNASAECDLASVGSALDWQLVKAPTVAVAVPPKPSSCDAGTD